ncbi:hypothetical protein L7F22_048693 [Adiantum nelumboides]|nr:hypothetical protein [Adiantum nelumboides]
MRKDDVRDRDVVDDSACLQDNPVFEMLPDFQPGNPYIPLVFAAPLRLASMIATAFGVVVFISEAFWEGHTDLLWEFSTTAAQLTIYIHQVQQGFHRGYQANIIVLCLWLSVLQMGRTKGPEWDFVQKLNAIGRGMFVCKCKYYPHVYDGGPNRIRADILGIKGEGVAACLDPPDAIKEICKKQHVAKGKMSSQGTDVNDHVDANIEQVLDGQDAEKVSSQSHMDVDINVCPSMKKAKLSSDKNTLAKAWQMQAQKAATVAVRRFFYAEDVPHWKVRSPFFLNMVKAIGQAGPSYVPPSYHLLRTKELVEEVRCINGDLLDVKEKWKKYDCTIVSDG